MAIQRSETAIKAEASDAPTDNLAVEPYPTTISIEQNECGQTVNSSSPDDLTATLDATQPDTTSKDMTMTTETAIAAGDSLQLNVSSTKVWNTTELLTEILSHLTASELITVGSAQHLCQ